MTVDLACRIAFANQGLAQSDSDLADIETFVANQFLAGSQGHINLHFLPSMTVSNAAAKGKAVSARDLHLGLIESNGNPPRGPVSTISILLASSYDKVPAAFGMMFDRGFTTEDDQNADPQFLACPRQGCAVFVDTISNQRPSGFAQEVWYTTAHELGHVFNLQHDANCEADPNCRNFMRPSGSETYGPEAFHFAPADQDWLAQCDTDPDVMPGGSIFGSGSAADVPGRRRFRSSSSLKLEIALASDRVWRFQPFQLGLKLSLNDPHGAPVEVPDLMDPASGTFRIFIEDDRRERRLYRSPVRTCGPPAMLAIAADRPYRRDLPIFGQAGGYTFRRPGGHRLWAEFDIGRVRLTSNVVEIDVRPEVAMKPDALYARALLQTPAVASFLFHRDDHPDRATTRVLAHAVSVAADLPGSAEIHYSIAQALAKSQQLGRELPGDLADPSAFFSKALDRGGLLDHQRSRAEAYIASSDTAR